MWGKKFTFFPMWEIKTPQYPFNKMFTTLCSSVGKVEQPVWWGQGVHFPVCLEMNCFSCMQLTSPNQACSAVPLISSKMFVSLLGTMPGVLYRDKVCKKSCYCCNNSTDLCRMLTDLYWFFITLFVYKADQ